MVECSELTFHFQIDVRQTQAMSGPASGMQLLLNAYTHKYPAKRIKFLYFSSEEGPKVEDDQTDTLTYYGFELFIHGRDEYPNVPLKLFTGQSYDIFVSQTNTALLKDCTGEGMDIPPPPLEHVRGGTYSISKCMLNEYITNVLEMCECAPLVAAEGECEISVFSGGVSCSNRI